MYENLCILQIINQYESKKTEMKAKLDCLKTENVEKCRLEDDVNQLRTTLDALEVNFEREKTALLIKERELEILRSDLMNRCQQRQNSITDLQSRLMILHENGGRLKETDILGNLKC